MDQSTNLGFPQQEQPAQQQTPSGVKPPALGYEFTAFQNETIQVLSSRMKFVGVFYIVTAVLFGLFGVAAIYFSPFVGSAYLVAIVPQLLIGIWTANAASSFRRIVDTKGHDIPYLMNALISLRKLYTLQFWLLIVAIAFIILGIGVGIFLWMSGMLPLPVGTQTVAMVAL